MVTTFPLAPKYLRAADNAGALGQLLLSMLYLSEKFMEVIYSLNSAVSALGYVCWASCYFLQFISRGVICQYTLRVLCQKTFVIQKSGLADELRDEG